MFSCLSSSISFIILLALNFLREDFIDSKKAKWLLADSYKLKLEVMFKFILCRKPLLFLVAHDLFQYSYIITSVSP